MALATACGQPADSTPADGGSSDTVERIVVLDLGSLDTLRALGASDQVVGVPKGGVIPEHLSEFSDDQYADVGTLQEPDIEKIAELDPDLVIAGFRSSGAVEELSKHFTTIDVTYDQAQPFLDGVEEASLKIGEAIGKESEAQAKIDDLRAQVEEARAEVPEGKTALALISTGGKLNAQGADGRYALIFRDLGLEPAAAGLEAAAHGDPMSFEAIQDADADYLFVVDRDAAIGQQGGEAAQQVLDNPLIHETTAWKEDQIVYLDGGRWYLMIHGLDNAKAMITEVTDNL